jgi:hypothetical protein
VRTAGLRRSRLLTAVAANFTVKAPKVKPAKLNLANGLTPVSFAQDGVARLLADRCLACHAWAASAATAQSHAAAAVVRVRSGQMPQGGTRLTAAQVSLLAQWVSSGMNP